MSPSDEVPEIAVTAVIAERILQEVDGVLSAIRIADRVAVALGEVLNVSGSERVSADGQTPAFPIDLQLAVMFRQLTPGPPRSYEVTMVMSGPAGSATAKTEPQSVSIGYGAGANIVSPLRMFVKVGGLYRLDVLLDGERRASTCVEVDVTTPEPADDGGTS